MSRIEELRAEIQALEDQEKQDREERRNATRREWRFTFTPVKKANSWDLLWDDTHLWWRLEGKVINAEECKAVGYGDDHVRGGGMNYLVDMNRHRIVMQSGGGNIYLVDEGRFGFRQTKKSQEALKSQFRETLRLLELLIEDCPTTGGDVTEIITQQDGFCW